MRKTAIAVVGGALLALGAALPAQAAPAAAPESSSVSTDQAEIQGHWSSIQYSDHNSKSACNSARQDKLMQPRTKVISGCYYSYGEWIFEWRYYIP
ncbi:hypothetical protein [Salininema proteolyticum]|uniref:Uncharacterized protein n=1 Tax=Salininema proteolyticum TaxID=1607685 RepID=A0ABV8TVK0_9ACTN